MGRLIVQVTYRLLSPVALPSKGPLTLAGPLARVAARRKDMGIDGSPAGRFGTGAWVDEIELPLARECGVWAASMALWPEESVLERVPFRKKGEPVLLRREHATGPMKDADLVLEVACAPWVRFLAEPAPGREEELLSLLEGLSKLGLGSKTSLGFGLLGEPEIREVEGSAVWDAEGQPLRPVPADEVERSRPGFEPGPGTSLYALSPDPPGWGRRTVLCWAPAKERWFPFPKEVKHGRNLG